MDRIFEFAGNHTLLVFALVTSFLLVIFTVYVFLQDFRTTLVPAITIPVSLIGTFFVMKAMGMTINNLTLFGLVLAIGIVVDDAIVVVENTMRLIDEEGMQAKQAVSKARGIGLIFCNELFGKFSDGNHRRGICQNTFVLGNDLLEFCGHRIEGVIPADAVPAGGSFFHGVKDPVRVIGQLGRSKPFAAKGAVINGAIRITGDLGNFTVSGIHQNAAAAVTHSAMAFDNPVKPVGQHFFLDIGIFKFSHIFRLLNF